MSMQEKMDRVEKIIDILEELPSEVQALARARIEGFVDGLHVNTEVQRQPTDITT